MSWTWLSVLRGAAAAVLSEYRACKLFTLEPANMRCWVQIPSQRMMRLNKSRKQNIFVMSFVQQNKYVPQYVPHGPHFFIFVNKISNLQGLNGGGVRLTSPSMSIHLTAIFYKVTKERHSLRAASRFSLKVLRFESDLCELNRL